MTNDNNQTHANHVTHVDSADEVGQAHRVQNVSELHITTPSPDERKVIMLKWIVGVAIAVALAFSSVSATYQLFRRDSSVNGLTQQVAGLETALKKAQDDQAVIQAKLDAATAARDEVAVCESRLTRNITARLQEYLTALGDLVVDGQTGRPQNEAATVEARQAYADSTTTRDAWVDAGSPLPCPLSS